MQSDRLQIVLITVLAASLGAALTASDAVGYPAGTAVSMGSNPVFSGGGSVDRSDSAIVLSASADQDMVITDVSLGMFSTDYYCKQVMAVRLLLEDGTVLAQYPVMMDIYRHGGTFNQTVNMTSGIRLPAGQALWLSTEAGADESCGGARVDYTLSGYYAQP
jgi:hypothetical protein